MPEDQLEELNESPQPELSEPEYAQPQAPPPSSAAKAFPQLYRFFWGGLIVFIGSLLPFGPVVVTSMYDAADIDESALAPTVQDQMRDLADTLGTGDPVASAVTDAAPFSMPAVNGYETFMGALFLLFGLMLMGQMWAAIRDRKVALGAVLLMLVPAVWTWYKVITLAGQLDPFSISIQLSVMESEFESLALNLGSGFILVLIGSSFVAFNFVMALFGAATSGGDKRSAKGGGDKRPPAAAGGRSGRASRR